MHTQYFIASRKGGEVDKTKGEGECRVGIAREKTEGSEGGGGGG